MRRVAVTSANIEPGEEDADIQTLVLRVQRQHEMMSQLNEMIQESNKTNKTQKYEYTVVGSVDVRSKELTIKMLEMMVATLEDDPAITSILSLRASRKFAGNRGSCREKLVTRASELLPPTSRLETGGVGLQTTLESLVPSLTSKIELLAAAGAAARADIGEAERALLTDLTVLEKKKSQRLKKKLHPEFQSVDTLQNDRLSAAQRMALTWEHCIESNRWGGGSSQQKP